MELKIKGKFKIDGKNVNEIKIANDPINVSTCSKCGTSVTTFRPLKSCIWCDGRIDFD